MDLGNQGLFVRDLCNWQDEGYLVEPDVDDPASPLHPSKRVDRPHILRWSANGTLCAVAEAVRERRLLCRTVIGAFAGPLSDGKSLSAAGGRRGGDFDMVQVLHPGKANLYVSINHSDVVGYALTADYLNVQEEVSRQYGGLHSPFTREGIAVFEHTGRKYMLTSGMSGYLPNRSDSAVSGSWEEPFVSWEIRM